MNGTGLTDAISVGYRLNDGRTSTVESFGDSGDQWQYGSVNIEQGEGFRITITCERNFAIAFKKLLINS